MTVAETLADAFHRDGVVRLAQALDADEMARVDAAFAWRLENKGALFQALYPEREGTFVNARGRSIDIPEIHAMLAETRVPELVARIFGSGPVWFHGEQVFFKDARGKAKGIRRTPWHQDAGYDPFEGPKIAIVWINLDPVPGECALEVVRASHRGPLYNPPRFAGDDDTAGMFNDPDRPRMPDIEATRDDWDIVSWPAERGDLLVFHSRSLHGGGGVRAGDQRRSLTLRFVGDDVVRCEVPHDRAGDLAVDPNIRAIETIDLGRPYHESGLLMVHPGIAA